MNIFVMTNYDHITKNLIEKKITRNSTNETQSP